MSGLVAACGGGSGSLPSAAEPGDAGSAHGDSGTRDAAAEAQVACVGTNTPCGLGGTNGLCDAGTCSPCAGSSGDAACTAAYGSASGPQLCIGGACVPGNCRTGADCPATQVCGGAAPHTCGACTTDAQCAGDPAYGPSTMCRTAPGATHGTCVTRACQATQVNSACSANPADVCCPSGASQACFTGNCCADSQCAGTPSTPYCVGNLCSACDAIGSSSVFYVDAVNGSDASFTTGSGTAGGTARPECAFQSIAHAIDAIVAAGGAPAGTRIVVLGSAVTSATDRFPLTVPANVTVEGSSADPTALTVSVPASSVGFRLTNSSSGLKNFTLEGGGAALHGVFVTTGSATTTSLAGVLVQNFDDAGIRVEGSGVLAITGGTQSSGNGLSVATHPGLYVTENGSAIVSGGTPSAPTAFDNNGDAGILVDGNGSIQISGSAGTGGSGTVVVRNNATSGIVIRQSPAGTAPRNVIDGVVVWGSGTSGMTLYSGSRVKLRNSRVLASQNSGVMVVGNPAASSVDVTTIDLGTSAGGDWGKNVLQISGTDRNLDSGVCLAVPAGSGVRLLAAGNMFRASDCSVAAATLTSSACANGAGSDVGIVNASTNAIATDMCTYP